MQSPGIVTPTAVDRWPLAPLQCLPMLMSDLNSAAIWASKCLACKFLFLLHSWLLQKYFGQIKKHFTIACVCVYVSVCVGASVVAKNGQNACTLSQAASSTTLHVLSSLPVIVATNFSHTQTSRHILYIYLFCTFSLFLLPLLIAKKLLPLPHLSAASPSAVQSPWRHGQRILVIS